MSCRISFFASGPCKKFPWKKRLEQAALALLKSENVKAEINVVLCPNAMQRALNKKYRSLDHVTDVLSFVWNESGFLGEIYIAQGQVKKQAPFYGNSYYKELKRVLIHGLLHLCRYNHKNKAERKIMREKEAFYSSV
ncbi:MAG: rRNA maturation RNase YbeY [Fibromonadaceae bacterium]|jgi:probable rRNA maturation factor|nr:rRNA maturation RNase YbeY [Fibromonadaceae bacterium]